MKFNKLKLREKHSGFRPGSLPFSAETHHAAESPKPECFSLNFSFLKPRSSYSTKSIFKSSFGFSLFEVLIAMSIMSSAAVLLYVAWSGNQVRVQKMAINNKAAFLLDQKIAELEIEYGRKINDIPDKDSGPFEEYPKFSWSMESKDFEMPDLRSVLISDGDADEGTLMIVDKLTEYLNESVKEMKVTVKYTIGKKSVKYSATTFLVDYNRSIPMGPLGGGGGGGPLTQ